VSRSDALYFQRTIVHRPAAAAVRRRRYTTIHLRYTSCMVWCITARCNLTPSVFPQQGLVQFDRHTSHYHATPLRYWRSARVRFMQRGLVACNCMTPLMMWHLAGCSLKVVTRQIELSLHCGQDRPSCACPDTVPPLPPARAYGCVRVETPGPISLIRARCLTVFSRCDGRGQSAQEPHFHHSIRWRSRAYRDYEP
jgi:hypothetical protein